MTERDPDTGRYQPPDASRKAAEAVAKWNAAVSGSGSPGVRFVPAGLRPTRFVPLVELRQITDADWQRRASEQRRQRRVLARFLRRLRHG